MTQTELLNGWKIDERSDEVNLINLNEISFDGHAIRNIPTLYVSNLTFNHINLSVPPPTFMPNWNCWYLKAMLDLCVRQSDVGAFMHQIFSFEAWSVCFSCFWIWTRQSMHVIFEWFHRTSCMRCFDCVVMIMSDRFASESSVYSSHLSCVWIE